MAPVEEEPPANVVEDTPVVKELKKIDDQYLEVEREFEKELNALMNKFTEMQKPHLEQRAKLLAGDGSAEEKVGTPALKGFWFEALQNHPAMKGEIEEWDEPVLQYVKDITVLDLDPEDHIKGFRLRFIFAENPYFENAILSKEYHTTVTSPYTGEREVQEIRGCTINWKKGKDVTVETVAKKVKGGGAKKAKQKGAKQESRNSLFRGFFRTMKADGPLPDDVDPMAVAMACGADDDEMEDEEALVKMVMESDYEVGVAIRDCIIPFAVRWYTGEAVPEDDDDDDDDEGDEEEEEEEEDEDDADESEEDEKPVKGKKGGKPAKKKALPAEDGKKEECKQQ